jgi:imidazolonepropionase-like amidohydrolase/ABC-type multidrug transport system permease subunit
VKAFLALLKIDLKLASRNRAVLFFNFLFPLMFFFIFAQMFGAKQGSSILEVVTMVTVIGILGNGLFGAGIRAVQEREENILRRYKVTPITPVPLIAASMITGIVVYLPTVIVILFLANRIYGMSPPPNLGSFFVFICIATLAFRAIGSIVAAVVNTSQEAQIVTQLMYMPMLFLSGATIPFFLFPTWLQIVAQFIPATYLVSGISGILQHGETVAHNWKSVVALLIAASVGLFIATKIFRWEKEEKIRPAAKLWVVAVLLPFFLLGIYQAWSRQELTKSKVIERQMRRGRNWLIENARIYVGNGKVIENGAIFIKDGKIAEVYEGSHPEPKELRAEKIDAAGKTVLPGLFDVHVHLGSSGGFPENWKNFDPKRAAERALEAYLYCGVTAVRSAGDRLDMMIALRKTFGTGEKLGADLFFCGPLFTTQGGHGTEYAQYLPEAMRESFNAQFLRTPKNPDEARKQVDDLAAQNVNAIKGVLERGVPGYPFNRMDINILKAVVEEAHAKKLPVAIHCGNAADVADAVSLGADSIEHGSLIDEIPDELFTQMKTKGIAYDPTLSVAEGLTNFAKGDTSLLKRSLVQQVTPQDLLTGTDHAATGETYKKLREGIGHYPMSVETGAKNLLKAWRAGVTLVTGSDAGNFLVLHGPTTQHEIELWVAAGIPIDVSLQSATLNSARLLRIDQRTGSIEKGKEATLLVVDGNPLQDVRALSSIATVFFKGERVVRTDLFDQK